MAPQTRQVSKACSTCKARRIKCDENRPVCQRCIRSGRQCAYATEFDLVHRDQTHQIRQRFSQAAAQRRGSSSRQSSGASAPAGRRVSGSPAESRESASSAASRTSAATSPSQDSPPDSADFTELSDVANYGANVHTTSRHLIATDTFFPAGQTSIFVGGEEVDERAAAIAASGSRVPVLTQRQLAVASSRFSDYAQSRAGRFLSDVDPETAGTAGHEVSPTPRSGPSMKLVEVAVCHFASNFFLLPRAPTSLGFFQFLGPILTTQAESSSIQCALRACSFAALGHRRISDRVDLNAMALSQYTMALAKTTAALQDPAQSSTDATLATVLLLGLFETITARKEMVAWRSHVAGAVHIMKQREQQRAGRPRTTVERLLFNAVRLQMVASLMSADTPRPLDIDLWEADTAMDATTVRFQRLVLATGKVRLEANALLSECLVHRPADMTPIMDMVMRMRSLDGEIAKWLSSLSSKYRYYNAGVAGEAPGGDYSKADAYPGRIDVYPNLGVGDMWNSTRCCRLLLMSMQVRLTAFARGSTDYRMMPEYPSFVRVSSRLISDLISAVPFFLGSKKYAAQIREQHLQSTYYRMAPSPSGFSCGDDHSMDGIPKAVAGLMMVWTLACLQVHDCTTKTQRSFVAGRFQYIIENLGLRYAQVYASAEFRFPSMYVRRDAAVAAKNASSSRQQSPEVKEILDKALPK